MSAVFRGGTSLGFSKVINDLRSVGRALQSLTRISIPTPRITPVPKMGSILAGASKLTQIIKEISKPIPRAPRISIAAPGIATATRLGKLSPSDMKDIEKQFAGLEGIYKKLGMPSLRRAIMTDVIPALKGFRVYTKGTAKSLSIYTSEIAQEVNATRKVTDAKRRLAEEQDRLQEQIRVQIKAVRASVQQQVWGKVPIVGGIMGAFGQARARREQIAGQFKELEAVGAPVGRTTKAVAGITGALGPLGAVLKGVISIGQAFAKISIATIRFGVTLAKLPFRVLSWIHRSIQSIMFTFVMFTHLFQRFFREAFGIIKDMQVATLVASGSLEGLNRNVEHAINLSTRYAVPLEKIAAGYIKVAKAGFDVTEQNEIMGAVVQATTMLMSDLNQIADVLITSLKAWGMNADQSTRIVQILANAVSKTKATWTGLATALGYAAAAASEANVPFRDTVAIISQFIDKGLRASRAGMAFRTMIAGLDKVIGHAVQGKMNLNKAIEVLGINWEKYADKEVLPLIDILGELNHVMADGLDTQERLALMQIFGRRYYSQIIRLARDGSSALHSFSRSLEELNDLQVRADKMSSSLIGTFIILRSIWMTFKVTILQQLQEPLKGLSGTLENLKDLALRVGESLGQVLAGRAKGLADWFKRIVSGEGVEQIGSKTDAIAGRIDFWIGKIGKAAKGWMESVLGDAYKDTGNIVDFIGIIMLASIEVSKSVTNVFKEIFANKNAILTIVGTITDLIKSIFLPFLGLVIDAAVLILNIISKISFQTFEFTDEMKTSLKNINARVRVLAEGSLFDITTEATAAFDRIGGELEVRIAGIKNQLDTLRTEADAGFWSMLLAQLTGGVLGTWAPSARGKIPAAEAELAEVMALLAEVLKSKKERDGELTAAGLNRE